MKTSLIIISSFLIIFFITINFNKLNFLYLSEGTELQNMNVQGIECIDDKVNIIDHGGEIFELIDSQLNLIGSLLRKDANTIKEKNSLVHSNSILLINKNMLVSNALDKLPAKIASIDYDTFIEKGYVTEDNYKNLNNNSDAMGIYLEKINFNDIELIFSITKDFGHEYSYQFYDSNLSNIICSANLEESNIQNVYWSRKTNILSIIKNPIKHRFGQINNYKMSEQDNCFKFDLYNTSIILNAMELQDFKRCGNSNYYAYTKDRDSYIFKKIISFN